MLDNITSAYSEVLKRLSEAGVSGLQVKLACKCSESSWGARLIRRLVGLDFASLTKEVWKVLDNPKVGKEAKDKLSSSYKTLIKSKKAQEMAKETGRKAAALGKEKLQLYEELKGKVESRTTSRIAPLPNRLGLSFIDKIKEKLKLSTPTLEDTLKKSNCLLIKETDPFDDSDIQGLYQKELSAGLSLVVIRKSKYGETIAKIFTPKLNHIGNEISFNISSVMFKSSSELLTKIKEKREIALLEMHPILSKTSLLSEVDEQLNLDYTKDLIVLNQAAAEIADRASGKLEEMIIQLKGYAKELNITITSPRLDEYECTNANGSYTMVTKGLKEPRKHIHAARILRWASENSIQHNDEYSLYNEPFFKLEKKTEEKASSNGSPPHLYIELSEDSARIRYTGFVEHKYSNPGFFNSSMYYPPIVDNEIPLNQLDPLTQIKKIKTSVDEWQTLLQNLDKINENRSEKLTLQKINDQYFLKKVGNDILQVQLEDLMPETMENKAIELEDIGKRF